MRKTGSRLFLAAMTLVCLWGAYHCPTQPVLPDASDDLYFDVIRLDYQSYNAPWRASGGHTIAGLEAETLLALLQAGKLQPSLGFDAQTSVQARSGDVIFYCPLYHTGDVSQRMELRLYQLAGQTKGYLYLPDGTCYALEPTAPLLEFVKARI